MHFVYTMDNLFRSIRVSDENSSVTKDFNFFNLFQLHTFCEFNMHHSKPHPEISTITNFTCYFSCIEWFFCAEWPWNWKAVQMNSEKVATWYGIIISPTQHVLKSWEGYSKNWMHFVYKMDNLFRSIRVSDENSSVTKAFYFYKLILTPDFLCVQYEPFKAISSIFNPFLTSFAIFHAFHDLFWAKWPSNWQALQMIYKKVKTWHGIIISPT